MISRWRMKFKYLLQKGALYSYVLMRTHMEQHVGQPPALFQLVRALIRIMDNKDACLTALKSSAAGGEAMKPTIRGTKDEWVLYRYLLPPLWHNISVGDVVGMSPVEAKAASGLETDAASAAALSAASTAAASSLPIVFRRVAAIPGDEIVSSRSSDEPLRIERNHFWLLADNSDVPAQEAIDSRTLGPVHVKYIVGRALYLVRSPIDHEPVQNSSQATIDDAPVMAMECNIEDVLKRIKECN